MNQQDHPPQQGLTIGKRGVQLATVDDMKMFASLMLESQFAPPSLNTVPKIVVALQLGLELGQTPMWALQNVCAINGKPSVYGDGIISIVRGSGKLEWMKEGHEGEAEKYHHWCEVKRVGEEETHRAEFGMEDARAAGLLSKKGPWQQYPKRMCMWRSRSWAMRAGFADVLHGTTMVEEAYDMPREAEFETIDATPAVPEKQTKQKAMEERILKRAERRAPKKGSYPDDIQHAAMLKEEGEPEAAEAETVDADTGEILSQEDADSMLCVEPDEEPEGENSSIAIPPRIPADDLSATWKKWRNRSKSKSPHPVFSGRTYGDLEQACLDGEQVQQNGAEVPLLTMLRAAVDSYIALAKKDARVQGTTYEELAGRGGVAEQHLRMAVLEAQVESELANQRRALEGASEPADGGVF